MTQSVAASLPPITAAAPSHAALRAEMNAANTSIQNRIKDLMQRDPILSKFKNTNYYGIQVNATPYMNEGQGGDTSIMINGTAFSVRENKVKGKIYKQVRVSMPELLQALDLKKR